MSTIVKPADEETPAQQTTRLQAEFDEVFPRYMKQSIAVNWAEEFKGRDIPNEKKDVCPLLHLRKLPIGELLSKWRDSKMLGYLPVMATHSRASIGSLLASSFCERINSGGKITLNEGNARLSQSELDMRTTLRLNKGFMDFMRKNYPRVASMNVGSLKRF